MDDNRSSGLQREPRLSTDAKSWDHPHKMGITTLFFVIVLTRTKSSGWKKLNLTQKAWNMLWGYFTSCIDESAIKMASFFSLFSLERGLLFLIAEMELISYT